MALVINAPVTWLERKGLKRGWACVTVFGIILIVMVLLGWLIIPKISEQLTMLITNLPSYADQLSKNISSWFKDYPDVHKEIEEQGVGISQWLPSIPKTLLRIGNYSLSIVASILIGIVFISMVVYAVSKPRPLLQLYFSFFPLRKHEKATIALFNTSTMLIGWMKANLIAGTIRAICITIFLSFMNVPGAFIWGAVAFISELIPKLGFYIAAIPPILVALSVSPSTALWVTVFFLALDEVMGDFILPKLRSNSMNIHPVSTLFILLAMGAAFGVMGALLATPMAAIIKAYYEAFFIKNFKEDADLDQRIDTILYRKKEAKDPEVG
jgi:putative permease